MKKFVVVGNCQARPLSVFLSNIMPTFRAGGVIVVHLSSAAMADAEMKLLASADIIFAQLVGNGYRAAHLTTKHLRHMFGDKVVAWPNAFFHGQCTDTYYISTLDRRRIFSPLAEYHSRIVFEGWRKGWSVGETVQAFRAEGCDDPEDIRRRAETSLVDLRKREAETSIHICDDLAANWRVRRQFFTFNHPSKFILHSIAQQLASVAGIKDAVKTSAEPFSEPLARFLPLVPTSHVKALDLKYALPQAFRGSRLRFAQNGSVEPEKNPELFDLQTFVEQAFTGYASQGAADMEVRLTPA